MKNYVLAIKKGSNVQIGRKSYTKVEAMERKSQMAAVGINVEVMTFDEAVGS